MLRTLIRHDTDMAMQIMAHLAGRPSSPATATAAAILRALSIPTSFGYKVLRRLVQAGILAARRGNQGGFRLARPLSRISLLDVIRTVQPPLLLTRCAADPPECNGWRTCTIGARLRRLQADLNRGLRATRLSTLLGRPARRTRATT